MASDIVSCTSYWILLAFASTFIVVMILYKVNTVLMKAVILGLSKVVNRVD